MRTLLSATGVSVLILSVSICGGAMAGRNAGGAMVLHTNDAVNYSAGQDYCSVNPLPPACEELVTQINKDPDVEAMIWMVAAFPVQSSPGVNGFQVGVYGDVPGDYYTAFGPCGPGVFEIPDATWPAPGTGTACVFTSTVNSQLFKMYWFATASPGAGSTLSTGPYPGGDHQAEWADDSNPAQIDVCHLFGQVVWGGPGYSCVTTDVGACCFPDGHCEVVPPADCSAGGGTFQGFGTTCPPNPPCPPPIGACCLNGYCIGNLIETECEAQGGEWQGFCADCATFQCPPVTGACCICMGCTIQTGADCVANGGTYQGDGTSCDPPLCVPPPGACCYPDGSCNWIRTCQCATGDWRPDMPCDPNPCHPTPTKATTWGRIKSSFH